MTAPITIPPDRSQTRNLRRPNLGLVLNRNQYELDPRALVECRNARIKNAEISTVNMGWEPFPEEIGEGNQYNLDSKQVLLIKEFVTRAGTTLTLFANERDLFYHDAAGPTLKYLTPIFAGLNGDATAGNVGEVDNFHIIADDSPGFGATRLTIPVTSGYLLNVQVGDFIHFGSNTQILPTATWHEIASVAGGNLVLVTDPGVIAIGTAITIRQIFRGNNFDLWNGETFPEAHTTILVDGTNGDRDEDTIYVTNGLAMVAWNGNTLTSWWYYPGFVCRRFRYHRQIMLAYFIDEGGQRKPGAIKTSRLLFPEDFATEEATEFVSANGITGIQRLQALGDSLVAYYERDIEIITFVGPPLFWLIRSAVPGIGILSANSIADFGDFHQILSHDRAYDFDGVQITEAMPQVMREVLRIHAPNRAARAYVLLDEENGEAIWSIPLSTDGNATDSPPVSAYTEHYLESPADGVPPPMMKRDFPFTAAGNFVRDTGALRFVDFLTRDDDAFNKVDFSWDDRALQASFPFSIAGDGNGDIWILSTKSTKGIPASPYTAVLPQSVSFPYFAWVDGEANGLLQWVEPFANAGGNVYDMKITVHSVNRYKDSRNPLNVSALHDLSHAAEDRIAGTGDDERRTAFRVAARYGRLQFENDSTTKGSFFIHAGYRVKIAPMGDR